MTTPLPAPELARPRSVRGTLLLSVCAVFATADAPPASAQRQSAGDAARSQVENRALDRQREATRKTPRFLGMALTDEPLAAVLVEGNRTIPAHAILSVISTQPGRPAYRDQIADDTRELMSRRWFREVSPVLREDELGRPVVVFQVDEQPIVGRVEFRGNHKIKTKKLAAECGLKAGLSPYDVNANRQCVRRIRKMYEDAGYREARVQLASGSEEDQRDVIFEIFEGDKLAVDGFIINGNDFVSKSVLKTRLTTSRRWFRLIGGTYDPDSLTADEAALESYYRNLGFFDVKVKGTPRRAKSSGSMKLQYDITEGPRYRVRNVVFRGNDIFTDQQLRKPLVVREGRMFLAREVQTDVQALMDVYDETGRPYTKVEFTPEFTETPGEFDLVYTIEEDIVRYIGKINIHIRGDDTHTRETVARNQISRHVVPGTLAHAKDIRRMSDAVKGSRYWDRAEPAAITVRPVDGLNYMAPALARGQSNDAEPMPANPPAAADHRVNFGHSVPSAKQTLILPKGRTPVVPESLERPDLQDSTRDWLDNMRRPQGDDFQFNRPAVDPGVTYRGQSNVGGGTFRSQSIDEFGQPVPQSFLPGGSPQGDPFGGALSGQPPGFVDIDVDLTEARTGRFMFGAGVNSDAGVVGQITLEENNFDLFRPPRSWADIRNGRAFRGGGQSFRIEAAPGAEVSRYLVNWQDPYFLNTDYSFGVSGFFYTRFFEDWTEERLGGRISLGRIVNQNWSVNGAIRLENVNLDSILDQPGNPAPDILARARGDNFLSTGRISAVYDTRDSQFIPTRGVLVDLGYEQAFGDFVYSRFDASGSRYWTIYERPDGQGKHTLRLSGKFGYTGDDTPVFERYFAGGFQTFRGFEFRGVSPEINGRRVGGQFMSVGTLEYMLPVTADDNFKVVAFTDFGTVDESVSLEKFRASVGLGLRVNVPAMGPAPLAFDFAVPVAQEAEDDERLFSFYIGLTR